MFNGVEGFLSDIPEKIREYYTEEVIVSSDGVPKTVTELKSFGEIQHNVATVMRNGKSEDIVNTFLSFENNAIEKHFHDNWVSWYGTKPNENDPEFFVYNEDSGIKEYDHDLFSEAYRSWSEVEPVKDSYRRLEDYEEYRRWKQLQGVDFEGVMCSATKQDFWGLSAAETWIRAGNPTTWNFENGNKLLLTKDNIDEFKSVWLPFRLSFFD